MPAPLVGAAAITAAKLLARKMAKDSAKKAVKKAVKTTSKSKPLAEPKSAVRIKPPAAPVRKTISGRVINDRGVKKAFVPKKSK